MSVSSRYNKYRQSLRSRLFIIFTLITTVVMLIFTALFIYRDIQSFNKVASEKARLLASLLSNNIRLYLYSEDKTNLNRLAAETASQPQVIGVIITNNDGKVLVKLMQGEAEADRSVLGETVNVNAGKLETSAESALTGDPALTGASLGTVRVELDTSDLKDKIRELLLYTVITSLCFWALVLWVGYLALKSLTKSFDALMQGIETVRTGDYSHRITTNTDDEPAWAATVINDLASALEWRDSQNRRLQEELFNAMKLEVQEEKRHLMAKLLQTNRLTSLGLLVSSMAHEINNPTGSIRLAGQFTARAWKDALPILDVVAREEGNFSLGGMPYNTAREEITNSGETIIRSTNRIERVIHDLRAYSLGGRNEFRPDVDVNQVVAGALAIVRAHGRHGDISIAVEKSSSLPLVNGNQHQLEQVIINLIFNAIQAMSEKKGTITVSTFFASEENEVRILVRDEGVGIPPESREHLFEPFFSTRIDKGGSGLGLYISNFIINEHKGCFQVDSELDKGTVITVKLPVSV